MLPAATQWHLVDHTEIVFQASVEDAHVSHDLVHPPRLAADQGVWDHVLDHVIASWLHERKEVPQRGQLVLVPVRGVVHDDVKGQLWVGLDPRAAAFGVRRIAQVAIRGSESMQSGCTSMP